jgi:hypothetical protein
MGAGALRKSTPCAQGTAVFRFHRFTSPPLQKLLQKMPSASKFSHSVVLLRQIASLRESGLSDEHCGILKDLVVGEDERIFEAADAFVNDGDEEVFLDWMLHLCGVQGDENADVEVEEVDSSSFAGVDVSSASAANQEQMAQLMMEVQRQKKELQDKMNHVQEQLANLRTAKDFLQKQDGEDSEDEYEDDFESEGDRRSKDDDDDDDDYEDDYEEDSEGEGDAREDGVVRSQFPQAAPQPAHRRLSLTMADTADVI